jgi:hypothetical protein
MTPYKALKKEFYASELGERIPTHTPSMLHIDKIRQNTQKSIDAMKKQADNRRRNEQSYPPEDKIRSRRR